MGAIFAIVFVLRALLTTSHGSFCGHLREHDTFVTCNTDALNPLPAYLCREVPVPGTDSLHDDGFVTRLVSILELLQSAH
jgi:hypothetical protein